MSTDKTNSDPSEDRVCVVCGDLDTCPLDAALVALMCTLNAKQHDLLRNYIRASTEHTVRLVKKGFADNE